MRIKQRTTSFAPVDATPEMLWYERAAMYGDSLGNTLYGVVITVFVMTLPLLWNSRHERPVYAYRSLAFSLAVFICASLSTFGNMNYEQRVFVDDSNYPGGPATYDVLVNDMISYPAIVVGMWLQDGMMIWRFIVFYDYSWKLGLIPCLSYATSVALSILTLVDLGRGATYLSIYVFPATFISMSSVTTLVLSAAIVGRLFWMRRQVAKGISDAEAAPYTSVSAMIIESALISSASSLPQAILMGTHNMSQILTVRLIAQTQAVAPLLIIFRVAQGRAWTAETMANAAKLSAHGDSAANFDEVECTNELAGASFADADGMSLESVGPSSADR